MIKAIYVVAGILIISLLIGGFGLAVSMGDDVWSPTLETKTISVVDKTAEIVSTGDGPRTDYKVLADDGVIYHTAWEVYRLLEINGSYTIQAQNRWEGKIRDPYWIISDCCRL